MDDPDFEVDQTDDQYESAWSLVSNKMTKGTSQDDKNYRTAQQYTIPPTYYKKGREEINKQNFYITLNSEEDGNENTITEDNMHTTKENTVKTG